ncbi:PAS domain S-box protein [Archangium primigenium]|uniref:PAS domain-containing sensor histidine kinase n=1 Tax=[Archangium] primigenium TaxID=2792470 RepID=UPI00195BE7DB|nr:PAS domain S-box protein [Archangium primigenium]MBM7113424.1 PAS domain S-box protein [Archangium primigenium]
MSRTLGAWGRARRGTLLRAWRERLARREARAEDPPGLAPPVLLDALLDSIPVGLFFMDRALRYVRANRVLADMNGVPLEQLLGRSLWEVVPLLADRLAPLYQRVFATGEALLDQEISGVTAAAPGERRHWRVSYYPIRGPTGEVALVGGVLMDITDLKRGLLALEARQGELAETGQRLEAILETAVDGIFTCDERGRIQRANSAAGRIFGYVPEALVGRDVRRLLARPYRRELVRFFLSEEERGPGREWEVRGRRKDGRLFPLELSVGEVRLPTGGRLFVGTVRDISARRRSEQAQALFVETGTLLAQSLDLPTTLKNLAEVVVSHLSDYCLVDLMQADGVLRRHQVAARDASPRAALEATLSWTITLREGSPVTRVVRGHEAEFFAPVTPAWLDAVAEHPAHRALLGSLELQAVAILPLKARGHLLGLMSIGWTRLPSARLSEELEIAQGVADRAAMALDNARLYQEAQDAVRMREDVVAIVSHDLRNPLNAITLSASSLLRRVDVDARTHQTAQRISAAAERASRLIRDLLDFTQARVGGIPIQPAALDFHEHVRRVVDEVRLAWPGRVIHVTTEGEGQGAWDEGRLAQVITNLVGNALQHSPTASAVTVSVQGSPGGVRLDVHNEGPPILAEALPTLFEPYRRGTGTGERGGSLGLGLFITRQIIHGHGGSISVNSQPGDGTTFVVRLPRHPGEPLV